MNALLVAIVVIAAIWLVLRWAIRLDRYEARLDRDFYAEWAEAGRDKAGGSEPDASADLSRPVSVYDQEAEEVA